MWFKTWIRILQIFMQKWFQFRSKNMNADLEYVMMFKNYLWSIQGTNQDCNYFNLHFNDSRTISIYYSLQIWK